jgi:hypothetical protein
MVRPEARKAASGIRSFFLDPTTRTFGYHRLAMIAELKSLHSPDVEDLHDWVPGSTEFAILLQIMAGPEGTPGEESFDVTLCSPAWVAARVAEAKLLEGCHLLIVSEF